MKKSYKYVFVAGLLVAAVAALPVLSQAQTIDDFTTGQTINSGMPSGTVNGGASVIGSFRDAVYTANTGSSASLNIASGSYTFTRDASDNSIISVDWDGDNDAATLDETGLGGMDLTAGGANGFSFNATVNSASMDFKIVVHTDGGNASTVTVSVPSTGAQTVCYSDFSIEIGSGADFGNVGAIQLVTFGNNAQNWTMGALSFANVGGCSLPVELTSFDATRNGESVILNWATASETNTAGFAIEHRVGGAAWSEVGFVDAAGSVTAGSRYRFDVAALGVGTHAFRLRMVDIDGTFEYSQTVEVAVEAPGSFVLGAAYPNPFNPSTSFTLAVKQTQNVEIAVYDLLGRNVQHVYTGVVQANELRTFQVEGAGLPTGVYVVRASGEFESRTRAVMLLK